MKLNLEFSEKKIQANNTTRANFISGLVPLAENYSSDKYLYEVVVSTGLARRWNKFKSRYFHLEKKEINVDYVLKVWIILADEEEE